MSFYCLKYCKKCGKILSKNHTCYGELYEINVKTKKIDSDFLPIFTDVTIKDKFDTIKENEIDEKDTILDSSKLIQ